LLLLVATTIVGALLTPKPQGPQPSGLGDFTFPTAQEGRAIPIIAGTVKVGGPNVVWWGDLSIVPIKVKAGLFSHAVAGYKYFLGIQMTLAQGVVDDVVGLEAGNKSVPFTKSTAADLITLTIDAANLFGGTAAGGEGGLQGKILVYRGTATQNADPYLSQKQTGAIVISSYAGTGNGGLSFLEPGSAGVAENVTITALSSFDSKGNRQFSVVGSSSGGIGTASADVMFSSSRLNFTITSGAIAFVPGDHWIVATQTTRVSPAYRGVCYSVLKGSSSGGFYVGSTSYPKKLSFVLRRLPDPFAWGKTDPRVNLGGDANPALWIYEIMTDDSNGLGILPTDIETSSFQAAAVTLKNEGLGVSMQLDSQAKADQLLGEILRHVDGIIWLDPLTGLWNITLARADYDPDTLLDLGVDDILDTPQFARGSWSETINQVVIKYTDRTQDFNPRSVQAQDTANIALSEEVRPQTIEFKGLSNSSSAMLVAIRVLRTLAYPLSKVTLQTTRKAWNLRIGSVFKWTWPALGVDAVIYRVTRIAFGELGDGKISIEAVEDIFGLNFAIYDAPGDSGWIDPGSALSSPPAAGAFERLEEAPLGVTENAGIYVMTLVARTDPTEKSYQVWQDLGSGYTETADIGAFTPLGLLAADYSAATPARDSTGFTIQAGGLDLSLLESSDVGGLFAGANLALIDEELVSFRTVTVNGDGTITLSDVIRGAYDTIPLDHAAGARVFFVSVGAGTTQLVGYGGDDTGAGGGSGPPGAPGAPGTDGVDGSKWYEGTTVPSSGTGVDGDFYLRTTTGDVYTKTGGSWGSPIENLTGAPGAPGPAPSGAANLVVATPDGASGLSSLRALVAADIPALAESKITGLVADLGTLAAGISALTTGLGSAELTANKDAASGYAGLDSGGKLKAAEFPAFTGDVSKAAGSLATVVAAMQGNPIDSAALGAGQDGFVAIWSQSAAKITFVAPTAAGGANAIQIRGVNVSTLAPRFGDCLRFDGTNWVPAAPFMAFWGAQMSGTGNTSAAVIAIGCVAPTFGNATFANVPCSSTNPAMLKMTTPGTAQTIVYGVEDNSANAPGLTLSMLSRMLVRCRLEQTGTGTRSWIGMVDGPGLGTNVLNTDTPNQNYVAFRFSNGTDTTWKAICGTSSANQSVVDTGVAPDTATSQIFEITFDGTNVKFWINGVLKATVTGSNVPATSVVLRFAATIDNKNSANAVGLSYAYHFLYHQ